MSTKSEIFDLKLNLFVSPIEKIGSKHIFSKLDERTNSLKKAMPVDEIDETLSYISSKMNRNEACELTHIKLH